MRRIELEGPDGVRWVPDVPGRSAVLVLAGSSGRVDAERARLLAEQGCVTEAIRWFGGPGQQPGPWEVPVETFTDRVGALTADADRVVLLGTSFGAEAALVTASLDHRVDAVVAFSPTDVVWPGVPGGDRQLSHWTHGGEPLPFVPFSEHWRPEADPPSFRTLYATSRAEHPDEVEQATIAAERIPEVVCVVGCDDLVWSSEEHAERIRLRRAVHGLPTTVVSDHAAGHRAILPGEHPVAGGRAMARGGTEEADRRLGRSAWPAILELL